MDSVQASYILHARLVFITLSECENVNVDEVEQRLQRTYMNLHPVLAYEIRRRVTRSLPHQDGNIATIRLMLAAEQLSSHD